MSFPLLLNRRLLVRNILKKNNYFAQSLQFRRFSIELESGEIEISKKFYEKPFGINLNKDSPSGLYVQNSAWRDIPAGARFLKVVTDDNKIENILAGANGIQTLKNTSTPCTIYFAVQGTETDLLPKYPQEDENEDKEFWESLKEREEMIDGELKTIKDDLWWKKGADKPWLNLSNKDEPLVPEEAESAELERFLTAINLEEHIDRFHSMTHLVICNTHDMMKLEIPIQHRRKIARAKKHWLQYQNVIKYGPLPYLNADGSRSYSPSVGQQFAEISEGAGFNSENVPKHLQFHWFPPAFPELDWYPPEYKPHWLQPAAPRKGTHY